MKSDQSTPSATLAPHELKAFHVTLQRTHEDDVIDQSVAAFNALITAHTSRLPIEPGSPYLFYHYRVELFEIDTFRYMLSDEVSLRANVTAANVLANTARHEGIELLSECVVVYTRSLIDVNRYRSWASEILSTPVRQTIDLFGKSGRETRCVVDWAATKLRAMG